jgi:DNA polymerase I-like protein with 3'-5' exonuclease and polymerase domains
VPVINTQDLKPNEVHPAQLQVYCGLDVCLTLEVWQKVTQTYAKPGANQFQNLIYDFERALQGPALEMMLRGFRIDELERLRAIEMLRAQRDRVGSVLSRLAMSVWGKPLNPRSHKALVAFFYTAMAVPEQWTSQKGEKKLSMNRDSLEKIKAYFHAQPFVLCILKFREIAKQLETLETEIDPDGRLRTSLNIAGTKTGRWSSSKNAFGTGGNIFNIKQDQALSDELDENTIHSLRRMFISDQGKKLCVIDLEQAEARDVGWMCGTLFGDWSYLDAIEAGDLHTFTARLIWSDLPWTGDLTQDRKLAERKFYRQFSYRDMSKRGGHGSNYCGTPWTMSRHLKVPQKLMEIFQEKYFGAFPAIPQWQRWVAEQLQTKQCLITPLGRKLTFFGRPQDDATLREAVAAGPQSTTADRMSLGLWRVWTRLRGRAELLNQGYDSITFQFREGDEVVINEALELVKVPLRHGQRQFVIPGDAKLGWNWGGQSHDNPDGLIKWRGSDPRKRTLSLARTL